MKISNSFQKTVEQDIGRQYRLEYLIRHVKSLQDEEWATKVVVKAINAVRLLLSVPGEVAASANQVVNAGAVPILVKLLMRNDCPELQFEAAWALTNIAGVRSTSSAVAEEQGAINTLIHLLRSRNAQVREQCAWCLGNIAFQSAVHRERVLIHEGTIESLLLNMRFPLNDDVLDIVTWTVVSLCQGQPLKLVRAFIPVLCELTVHQLDGVRTLAVQALANISRDDSSIDAILESDSGIANTLVDMVNQGDPDLVEDAVRMLGNFVSFDHVQTQVAIDAGALRIATHVLNDPDPFLRKDMCWLLSNIACGTQAQVAELVKTPHLAEALAKIAVEDIWSTRREAIYVLANVCTVGGDEDVWQIATLDGLLVMADAVKSCGDDKQLAFEAVNAMINIRRVANNVANRQ